MPELEEDFFAACSRHFLSRYLIDPKEAHHFEEKAAAEKAS